MKCALCKSKMKKVSVETEVMFQGKMIRAINVPAGLCPACNRTEVPAFINERIKGYAAQYGDALIDFQKCSDKEDADSMIVLNMLWGM